MSNYNNQLMIIIHETNKHCCLSNDIKLLGYLVTTTYDVSIRWNEIIATNSIWIRLLTNHTGDFTLESIYNLHVTRWLRYYD